MSRVANTAVCRDERYKKEVIRWTSVQFTHCKTCQYWCDCTCAKCRLQVFFFLLSPFSFKKWYFQQHVSPLCFLCESLGVSRLTETKDWKGDQQAWRADELLLLGNSYCWFYIMLISKNSHQITGSCAENNEALLSVDQKAQGLQGETIMIITTLVAIHHAFHAFHWPFILINYIIWLLS